MGTISSFVVGIGASAGGLQAVTEMLKGVKPDATTAYVLAMHLDPNRPSHMAELLQRGTPLTVVEVRQRTILLADHLYVLAPGFRGKLSARALELEAIIGHPGAEMLIDALFMSIADICGSHCSGISLSGGGADGAAGLSRIMAAGGLVLVQDRHEAEFDAMPLAALDATTPTAEHSVSAMPPLLADFVARNFPGQESASILTREWEYPLSSSVPDGMSRLRGLLNDATGVDFGLYKSGTLQRRAERRMLLNGGGWDAYLERLADDAEELDALYADVLIGVTCFFRDPDVWERLATVLATMTADSGDNETRVWVPGCASGEEAYSLAIVLDEQLDNSRKPILIFATDLSVSALHRARKGYYTAQDLQHVSPERIERYFQKHGDYFRVNAALRETVTFAEHDLLHDAPFSRMDIVSCRNLLIYFKLEAHTRVLRRLHFALKRGGLLMLGRSETIGPNRAKFEDVPECNGLYRAFGDRVSDLQSAGNMTIDSVTRVSRSLIDPLQTDFPLRTTHNRIEHFVLEQRTLACVVIDREFQILHFYGPTERYLVPPSGEARRDLPSWIREGLFVRLHAVLLRGVEQQTRISVKGHMKRDGRAHQVRCTVEPIPGTGEHDSLLLVSFDDLPNVESTEEVEYDGDYDEPAARQLERELRDTRHELELVSVQLQSAVEEYRANHEEMLSLNEELLSSNEELEAAKEEQESLNEEMATINQEIVEKNALLRSANADLVNLFSSTGIPTIFLDVDLKVRRFTPSITQVMHLVEADEGRYIEHIKERYEGGQIVGLARAVVDEQRTTSTEVEAENGHWYRRVMSPYLSIDGEVCGVCITFEDVTAQKAELRVSDMARAQAESVVRTVRTPVLIVDEQYQIVSSNPAFFRLSGLKNNTLDGVSLEDLEVENEWIYRSIKDVVERVLRDRLPLLDHKVRIDGVSLIVNADIMIHGGVDERVLVALEDVTVHHDFKQASTNRLVEQQEESQRKDEWINLLGHELRNPLGIVGNAVQLLSAGIDSKTEQQKIISMMQQQIQHVVILLDSLLDSARIVAGKIKIVSEPLDLVELLTSVVQAHRLKMGPHQSLQLDPATPGDVIVQGDRTRIIEVADNLLTNASKYTPPNGEIRVCVTATDGWGQFSVQDNGVGISADLLPRIFDMFVQGEQGENTGPGLGLGLPLVKRLVELHEGEIEAHSDGQGNGSEFVVRLPLATEDSIIAVDEPAAPLGKRRRVLVIDDNVDAADVLAQLLRMQGHEVEFANNGPAALALAKQFDPDVVLLDIGMPGMGGYEVATKLRAHSQELYIIAVTGYSRDEKRLRAAGFDDYLSKPLNSARLKQALAELRGRDHADDSN